MGLRTAIVTGVHKKGASIAIFGDSAESDMSALSGIVNYRHSIRYGPLLGQWQWPREDDNVFDEPLADEPLAALPEKEALSEMALSAEQIAEEVDADFTAPEPDQSDEDTGSSA